MLTFETIPELAPGGVEKVEANKLAEAAPDGLPTSEQSLAPDEAWNRADEQRRQAASSETTEQLERINTPSTHSNNDGVTTDPSSDNSKDTPTSWVRMADKSMKDRLGKKKLALNNKQDKIEKKKLATDDRQKRLAVTKVLRCESTAYFNILGVKPESSDKDKLNFYVTMCRLINPKYNAIKDANKAYKSKWAASLQLDNTYLWTHVTGVVEAGKQLSLNPEGTQINEKEDDFDEMEIDFEGMNIDKVTMKQKSTLTQADFLQNIYNEAEPHLTKLKKDLNETEAKEELEKLNSRIEQRNSDNKVEISETDRVKALINIAAFFNIFKKAKPYLKRLNKDPTDAEANWRIKIFDDSLRKLNQKHGYFNTWILNKAGRSATKDAKKVQPSMIRRGEQILECRKFWEDNQFYVETEVNGLPYCNIQTANELEGQASKAYLENFDKKVMVEEGNQKYHKKNFNSYEGVVHVACKPPLIRMIVKNKDCKPRHPLIDILAVIDGKNTWITYSDLTAICEKDDALVNIEEYYDDRELKYPWDVPPKRTLKVIERKKSDGAEDSSSVNENTTSKASAGSSWNSVNENTTNEDSFTQKSENDEMQS